MVELTDLDIELKVFHVQFQDSLPERQDSYTSPQLCFTMIYNENLRNLLSPLAPSMPPPLNTKTKINHKLVSLTILVNLIRTCYG